ncbi:hypothetical protein AAC387_Pa09g1361 [Persea americana]
MWSKWVKCPTLLRGAASTRSLCTVTMGAREASSSLYRRLSALGSMADGTAAKRVLDEWVSEGKPVKFYNVKGYVRELRKFKNYNLALQLMEWLEAKGTDFSYSDHAICVDLLSKTKGTEAAERYFTSLPEPAKNQYTYGALLCCYCQEKMHEKATTLFEKMRDLHFASSTLTYNNVMSLYMKSGLPEKVPPMVEKMQETNILPDRYTYAILMNSYASLKDIKAVERVMKEAKIRCTACSDWPLYSNLAAIYITAGLYNKAKLVLKEAEKMIDLCDRDAFHFLISLYAGTSNLADVKRVWKSLKSAFPKATNMSYLVMLQSLAKLDDMDGIKSCFEEWESGYSTYDIRLSNIVINAYVRRGMIKEAESLLESIRKRGYEPNFWTMDIFVDFYMRNHRMGMAVKCMEAAVTKMTKNELQPCQVRVGAFLKYFVEEKDVKHSEELCKVLKRVCYPASELFNLLLHTYVAAGKIEPQMRQWIREDNVQMTSEMEKLLERVCPE